MAPLIFMFGSLLGFLTSMTAVLVFKVGFGFGALIYFTVGILSTLLIFLVPILRRWLAALSDFDEQSFYQSPD